MIKTNIMPRRAVRIQIAQQSITPSHEEGKGKGVCFTHIGNWLLGHRAPLCTTRSAY